MNAKVDAYLARQKRWRQELARLREVALRTGLTEDFKWGHPCYTLEGKNVALLHGFKEYCAVLFFKGALLRDPKRVLVQQTKSVQAARQLRFTCVDEIDKLARTMLAYLREAIKNERDGLKVTFKATEEFELPTELEAAFRKNRKLKVAFAALTPGRQRAYIHHIAQAKQSKTRAARIEKHAPRILAGMGLDD